MERRLKVTRALWVSILVLLEAILVCSTAVVYACSYNGKSYSLGARVDSSVCTSNGWQPPIQQPPARQPPGPA